MRLTASLCLALLGALAGCDVCSAKDQSTFSNLQCFASGPGGVLLRPSTSEGNATVSGQKCLATVDAGVIALRLQGTVCVHPSQTVPYTATFEADCAVTGLAPGTYSVGTNRILSVFPDGGVDVSHCGQ